LALTIEGSAKLFGKPFETGFAYVPPVSWAEPVPYASSTHRKSTTARPRCRMTPE
jgi:hypothetical protein